MGHSYNIFRVGFHSSVFCEVFLIVRSPVFASVLQCSLHLESCSFVPGEPVGPTHPCFSLLGTRFFILISSFRFPGRHPERIARPHDRSLPFPGRLSAFKASFKCLPGVPPCFHGLFSRCCSFFCFLNGLTDPPHYRSNLLGVYRPPFLTNFFVPQVLRPPPRIRA